MNPNFSQQNDFRIVFTSFIQKQSLNCEVCAKISIIWAREYLSRIVWTFAFFLLRIWRILWFFNIGSEFGIEIKKQSIDLFSIFGSNAENGRSFCRELSIINENEVWAKN